MSHTYEGFPTLLLDLSKKTFADLSQKNIDAILNDASLFSWKQYVPIIQEKRQKMIEKSAARCELEKQRQKENAPKKPAATYNKPVTASKPASSPVSRPISTQTPFVPYGETVRLATEDMIYQRIADEPRVVLDAHTGIRVGVCQVCKRTKSKDAFAVLPVSRNQKNVGVCTLCAEKRLSKYDNTLLYSGSYVLVGTMVVRTSYKLSNQEQIDLTNAIINSFTELKE